jgi:hypothetical protein
MKNWIKELCPEIAEWQVELLAEAASNAVEAEREACAAFLERGVDLSGLARNPTTQAFTEKLLMVCAHAIRARGEQ